MRKNRKKYRAKFIDNRLQLALIISALVLFAFFIAATAVRIFADLNEPWQKAMDIITGIVDPLSVFLLPALSVLVTRNVIRSKNRLEEELKIEPDRHKIICKYHEHSRKFIDYTALKDNMYDKDGSLMSLVNITEGEPRNPVDDEFSEEYFERQRDIAAYKNGRLLLPCLSVFTNNALSTKINFEDSKTEYELPSVLHDNMTALMSAHKASNVSDNVTIRLKDFDYNNATLTLITERSKYKDMLMTNRCMDFDIGGMSVRGLYENGSKVKPLKDSELCNQIGINGLVYTSDNYLLIEKRGRKKAVWKNKFAQPISLALKLSDVITDANGIIGSTHADAEKCFKKVISKTLNSNFGLVADGDYEFRLSQNFMGIARDLLEGGKPNLYFYVKVNMTAAELKYYLELNSQLAVRVSQARDNLIKGVKNTHDYHETLLSQISDDSKKELMLLISEGYIEVTDGGELKFVSARNAKAPDKADDVFGKVNGMKRRYVTDFLTKVLAKNLPKVNRDKLDSRFYLVEREHIKPDYNYAATLPVNKTLSVRRIFYPCVGKLKSQAEARKVKRYRITDSKVKASRCGLRRECGDALLASLYYSAVLDIENRTLKNEDKI